jgi:hypothetical protein
MVAAIAQAEASSQKRRRQRPLFMWVTPTRASRNRRAPGYARWVSSAAFNPAASMRVGPTPQ